MKGRHSDRNDISVKHYKSFYEAAKQLPTDIERLAFYVGIDEYRFEGKPPRIRQPRSVNSVHARQVENRRGREGELERLEGRRAERQQERGEKTTRLFQENKRGCIMSPTKLRGRHKLKFAS